MPWLERADSTDSWYNIDYRQVATQNSPVSTSSSYDYWWPYPPGGVTVTPISPLPSAVLPSTVISMQAIPSSDVSVLNSISVTSTPAVMTSSVPTSSASSISDLPTVVSNITSIMTSSTTSASITFAAYPQQSQASSANTSKADAYLIPICIALGAIVGCIAAWIGWGCLTRKPKIRSYDEEDGQSSVFRKKGLDPSLFGTCSELESGPAYQSSLSERGRDSSVEDEDSTEKTLLAPYSGFGWRAMDDDAECGRRVKLDNTDPERDYLAPPALPSKKCRTKSLVSSKRQPGGLSRAMTKKTAASVSVYSQVGEDEDEAFLHELGSSCDPLSPRAGFTTPDSTKISSRAVSISRRRQAHARNDSEVPLGLDGDDLRRSATARTQSSTRSAQTGFCMMEGSPLPTPTRSTSGGRRGGGFFWGNNEPETHGAQQSNKSKSGRSRIVNGSDSYTALPARGSRSRSSSPTKRSVPKQGQQEQARGQRPRQVSTRDLAIEDYYGAGLPQSPPQISSPQLHGSLCFSPKMG
ncbi:hypothetical protein D9757_003155 [Collybiopsis confluens]|uniref:Uncharacterized protein n=1 Tax=Collybiopsis confluens TaxID=2823264 RepID=A0A8H5HWZ7_9AGAR|nr:hypothetical protein D9757_003155 [Collybiopsis confluens]